MTMANKKSVSTWVTEQVATREAGRDCWLDWPHGTDCDGRPMLSSRLPDGKFWTSGAARFAYFAAHGRWPGLACHRCPNHPFEEDRRCWNWRHVYDGTPSSNTIDARKYARVRRGMTAAIRARDEVTFERWRAETQRLFDLRLAAERASGSCGLHGCAGDCSHSLGDLLVGPTVCVVKLGKEFVTFSSSPSSALPNDVAELADALDHLLLRHS